MGRGGGRLWPCPELRTDREQNQGLSSLPSRRRRLGTPGRLGVIGLPRDPVFENFRDGGKRPRGSLHRRHWRLFARRAAAWAWAAPLNPQPHSLRSFTHRWEPRPLARPRSKSRDLREASSEASRVDPTQAAAAAFRPDGPGCQIGTSRCTASGAAAARKAAPTIRALLFPVTREARTLLPI